ncbi:MAG: hypothetical protein A4E71_02610 [Smithella sp. PtaU1.Bin162]|nr:MAG: hypothetical protein A4E71_02610 [Smithella sp. PtaU1.Bin162]
MIKWLITILLAAVIFLMLSACGAAKRRKASLPKFM